MQNLPGESILHLQEGIHVTLSACQSQQSHLTTESSSNIRLQSTHPCLLAGVAGESLLRLKMTYGFHLLG